MSTSRRFPVGAAAAGPSQGSFSASQTTANDAPVSG